MMQLDHFAVSSPDLDRAMADFEALSGARPQPGGSHPGQGTRNALVSLGPGAYLARDGPDPEQSLVGNNGQWMAAQEGSDLFLFAVATDDLYAAEKVLSELGFATKCIACSRRTEAGEMLSWEFLETGPTVFGRAMPHIMTWKMHNHPTAGKKAAFRRLSALFSSSVFGSSIDPLACILGGVNRAFEIFPNTTNRVPAGG